jgi:hypothetical protein
MSGELERTKEEIEKKGAKWKAEKTSVSELSIEERRERVGLNPTDEELEKIKSLGCEKKEG